MVVIPVKASIAQLAEHALRKRTVVGSIPTGGSLPEGFVRAASATLVSITLAF